MRHALALLLLPALLFASGVVINETSTSTIDKIVFQWTSDSAGTATGTTTARYTGAVGRIVFDPGTPAPSDNYDIAIYDQNSYDILNSRGLNKDSVATSQIDSMFGSVANSKLTIVVVNAGDSTSGAVTLYIVPTTHCSGDFGDYNFDDFYQHVRQQYDPNYQSPLHRLYVKYLWPIKLVQKITVILNKIFGRL